MKRLIPLITCSVLLWTAVLSANTGGLQPGKVKAFQIKGDVSFQNIQTGETKKLKRGQELSQGYNIVTGPNSSALFLFSNGSTINIGENSNIGIERFLQAPFDAKKVGQYLMLKEDPSTSDTLIRMNHGELVGKVKKLKPDSFYDVETPIGSAGVRGTTFMVSFFLLENGDYAMKVGNLEGRVLLTTSMPANIFVNEQDVGEAEFDPTKTLSTGDVPESSVIMVIAKPQDVVRMVGEFLSGKIPTLPKPESFNKDTQDKQDLVQGAQNPAQVVTPQELSDMGLTAPTGEDGGDNTEQTQTPTQTTGGNPNDSDDKPPATSELINPSPTGGDL